MHSIAKCLQPQYNRLAVPVLLMQCLLVVVLFDFVVFYEKHVDSWYNYHIKWSLYRYVFVNCWDICQLPSPLTLPLVLLLMLFHSSLVFPLSFLYSTLIAVCSDWSCSNLLYIFNLYIDTMEASLPAVLQR